MLLLGDLSSGPVRGQTEAQAAHLEGLLKICGHSSGLRSLEHPPFPPAMSTRCTLWGAWPAGQVTLASEGAEAGDHFHRERKGPMREATWLVPLLRGHFSISQETG